MNNEIQELNILEWVQQAETKDNKEFREAIHTILSAIASELALKASMVLKGGILLAIRYHSNRYTKDIDLSTIKKLSDIEPEWVIEKLNQSLRLMVESLDYDLDCLIQGYEIQPANRPDASFPSMNIRIGYAYKGSSKHKRLLAKQSPTVVSIDYCFNEPIPNIENVELTHGEELLVYSITDLIAEKLRSLLQQEDRKRSRRQDIYDLFFLLSNMEFEKNEKQKILMSLLEKSRSRNIEPTVESFNSLELRRLAQERYHEIESDIQGALPDFDKSFEYVANFYRSLPWG